MPERDTFDLDAAFRGLEQDIAGISSPRGVDAAIATARRRHRRNTVGAVAAAVVLIAGIAVAGQGLRHHDRAVEPAVRPVPDPTPLTSQTLSTATAGWISGWGDPRSASSSRGLSFAGLECLNTLNGPSFAQPRHSGVTVVSAGSSERAYVLAMQFAADKASLADDALTRAAQRCDSAKADSTTYADGSVVTYYDLSGNPGWNGAGVWTVRSGNILALTLISDASHEPSSATVQRVDDLLLGALRPDTAASASGAPAPPPHSGFLDQSSFASALSGWSSGWSPNTANGATGELPCGVSAADETFGQGTSLGANGDQERLGFDNAAQATAGLSQIAADFQACRSATFDVHAVPLDGGGTVTVAATTGEQNQVAWLVQRGRVIFSVTVPAGQTPPPDTVSKTVGALMVEALGSSPVERASSAGPVAKASPTS
jgi:hypothetical protein